MSENDTDTSENDSNDVNDTAERLGQWSMIGIFVCGAAVLLAVTGFLVSMLWAGMQWALGGM